MISKPYKKFIEAILKDYETYEDFGKADFFQIALIHHIEGHGDMIFIHNDEKYKKFIDKYFIPCHEYRCICGVEINDNILIVNKDNTKYYIIGNKCCEHFGDKPMKPKCDTFKCKKTALYKKGLRYCKRCNDKIIEQKEFNIKNNIPLDKHHCEGCNKLCNIKFKNCFNCNVNNNTNNCLTCNKKIKENFYYCFNCK